MTNVHEYHSPIQFRIKLKENLNHKWTDWFGNMAISYEGEETILTGSLADQAALHGLLIRIRDMNLTLLSVEQIDPDLADKK